ncbi:ABC transporter permease [Aeromonas sp. HMWF036]|uniref:ABC transporter permease n=1 Tax=Aeromonas TaxID=642 RepID=UPI000D343A68|nr:MULTISPECIES: ABC transporter permease [Aeromonas]PTS80589.1 ABC transporter permease [Aeromonas sp. HMWF036]PTT23653.1 ABC transporter permease [Aeromonas sp. HMWF017]QWZ83162.1 ABC transporter permease [Aeromonas sp. FDAARGOS 1414]UDN21660.1 ABC transporter permease [Aeromonas veronii]
MSLYYVRGIWDARYFWQHLALSDLRSRWRRSFFGVLWSFIQPLGMTLLISIVFSKMFNTDIVTYAPYILSGIIVWDFVVANTIGGSLAFVQADAYIKQCKHPLAIYTLRTVLSSIIVLALASLALFAWSIVVLPQNINITWLATLTVFPILALIAWPLSTLLAYIGVRFRDVPHAMGLVMQAIWFISPVYFEERMFRSGGLDWLVDYNPVYHVLQIIRAPLLKGEWPSLENYTFSLITAAFLFLLAWLIGRNAEKKVIFYL